MADKPDIARAFDAEGRLHLQCWYCKKRIAYEGSDPRAVILVANWGDDERERSQQFFAHAECFRASGSGTDLYVLDPDYER